MVGSLVGLMMPFNAMAEGDCVFRGEGNGNAKGGRNFLCWKGAEIIIKGELVVVPPECDHEEEPGDPNLPTWLVFEDHNFMKFGWADRPGFDPDTWEFSKKEKPGVTICKCKGSEDDDFESRWGRHFRR